jgi:serine/threonine protein kinase
MSLNDFLQGKKLGEGRFGSVHMVVHKQTGAIFALKRIPKATLKEHLMIDQFALEVRLQAAINHPNLVSIYAVFDER